MSPSDVKEVSLELKITGSAHLENPAKMLNFFTDFIASPISDKLNNCSVVSYILEFFKFAGVVPTYKSKVPLHLNNYQPISLISVFSKKL